MGLLNADLIFKWQLFRQDFYSPGSLLQLLIRDKKNSSAKFSVILGQRPNIIPSSLHHSYLKHKLMSACPPKECSCWPHRVPCPHGDPHSFLSHLLFWNVLPDSAPPPRLLLSGLKYQSLPCEVRRDTLAAPARQENAGISSVFRVRISLSSSLSTLPSQINRRWRLPAHSFYTHEFPKTTLQWHTENLLKSHSGVASGRN